MAGHQPDHELLWQEALDLLIRHQNDPDNPVTAQLVTQWCARSPIHARIWGEAMDLHRLSGVAVSSGGRPVRRMSRRMVMAGGAAALAGLAGAAVLPSAVLRARADDRTGTAELKPVDLPDGSRATLGPESAIAIDPGAGARAVTLLAGLACFEVTAGGDRPFLVRAGDLTLRHEPGRAAVFDLDMAGGAHAVSVRDGQIAMRTGAGGAAALTCGQGERVTIDTRTGTVRRDGQPPAQFAAWRQGRLVAEGDPVAVVLSRLSRWYDGRILVADDHLRGLPISGIYQAADPAAAVQAVVAPYGGQVRRITPWLMVVTRT